MGLHVESDAAPAPRDSQSSKGGRHVNNKPENTAVSTGMEDWNRCSRGSTEEGGSERDQRGFAEQENRVCQEKRKHS